MQEPPDSPGSPMQGSPPVPSHSPVLPGTSKYANMLPGPSGLRVPSGLCVGTKPQACLDTEKSPNPSRNPEARPRGSPTFPRPPYNVQMRRQRQERTVYTKEQQAVLEEYFAKSRYPSYEDRLDLAKKIGVQERQIKVWFKNHRRTRRSEEDHRKHSQSSSGNSVRGASAAQATQGAPSQPARSRDQEPVTAGDASEDPECSEPLDLSCAHQPRPLRIFLVPESTDKACGYLESSSQESGGNSDAYDSNLLNSSSTGDPVEPETAAAPVTSPPSAVPPPPASASAITPSPSASFGAWSSEVITISSSEDDWGQEEALDLSVAKDHSSAVLSPEDVSDPEELLDLSVAGVQSSKL